MSHANIKLMLKAASQGLSNIVLLQRVAKGTQHEISKQLLMPLDESMQLHDVPLANQQPAHASLRLRRIQQLKGLRYAIVEPVADSSALVSPIE